MLDSRLGELLLVVLRLVQPNHQRHSHLLKYGYVIIGSERSVLVGDVEGTREGDKFTGHSPVQVTIFYFLVMLVLDDIESIVVIPPQFDSQIKTIEAVLVGAFVSTSSHGRISVGREFVMVWFE